MDHMQAEWELALKKDSLCVMLIFDSNTNPHFEDYGNDDDGADDRYNCCGSTAAKDGSGTAVLVGNGLIRSSTGFIAIRFEIGRHC